MPRLLMRCLLLSGLFFFMQNLQAGSEFLKPYRAVYDTNYEFILPLKGTAVRELTRQQDELWQLSHRIDASLLTLRETSLFTWQNNRPQSRLYRYQQESLGKTRKERLDFDWAQGIVRHQTDEPPGHYAIPADALDQLNFQLQLRQDLMAGKTLPRYAVTDSHRLKHYKFKVLGTETLDTPMGRLDTLKLQRDRGPNAERETILWLAKDWDYLLVKLHQKEDGSAYDVMMVEGEIGGTPITGKK